MKKITKNDYVKLTVSFVSIFLLGTLYKINCYLLFFMLIPLPFIVYYSKKIYHLKYSNNTLLSFIDYGYPKNIRVITLGVLIDFSYLKYDFQHCYKKNRFPKGDIKGRHYLTIGINILGVSVIWVWYLNKK